MKIFPTISATFWRSTPLFTTAYMGWTGIGNGELLAKAEEAGFAGLITMDKGLEHHQQLEHRQISIVLLRAPSNAMEDLLPLVADLVRAIDSLRPGRIIRVG